MGWSDLETGILLREAERQFDAFVTTDKNLEYQQNLPGYRLTVFVLPTPRWPALQPVADEIAKAVLNLTPGEFVRWHLPKGDPRDPRLNRDSIAIAPETLVNRPSRDVPLTPFGRPLGERVLHLGAARCFTFLVLGWESLIEDFSLHSLSRSPNLNE